jgi:hypothetical protein
MTALVCTMSQAERVFTGNRGVNGVSELRLEKRQNFAINWLSGRHG